MMLIHFGTRLEELPQAVRLPLAPAALPSSELAVDRLSVTLDVRGQLWVAGQVFDERATPVWWAAQAKSRRAGIEALGWSNQSAVNLPTVVIVRADRGASFGMIRRTLAEAQDNGFAYFSLVVLRTREE
jgi:biopolymer transport protein ExbD